MRRELVGGRAIEIELRLPSHEHLARRAMPETTINFGRSADACTFHISERHAPQDRRHASTSIQFLHALGGAHPVLALAVVALSFFEHRHVSSCARELERRHSAAGTGAYDEHVCVNALRHDSASRIFGLLSLFGSALSAGFFSSFLSSCPLLPFV